MGTHIHVHTSDKRRAEIFFIFYFLQKVKLMTVIRTKIEVLKFIEFISEDCGGKARQVQLEELQFASELDTGLPLASRFKTFTSPFCRLVPPELS